MSTEPYLLTPGPLTISMRTKQAMLRDWGSWDVDFNSITGRIRERLLQIVHGTGSHECVPMQGSGTFSVEAAIGTLVPRTGHVLVPQNGAYCQRIARICRVLGRKLTTIDYAENVQVDTADVDRVLRSDASITHVALVHCETSTGILNPLHEIAQVVARHGRGLIVDAMSSFGALEIDARTTLFDAVVAASGKCLEGPPGMGFVIVRRAALERCEGNCHSLSLDLYDQWVYMQKTTQWRYTPPTHVVAAFDSAIAQYLEEGALAARGARYARELPHTDRWYGGARPQELSARSHSGAYHRDFLRARQSPLRLQGLLQRRQGARVYPVSGKAHHGGDVPGRLHGTARRARHRRRSRGSRQGARGDAGGGLKGPAADCVMPRFTNTTTYSLPWLP